MVLAYTRKCYYLSGRESSYLIIILLSQKHIVSDLVGLYVAMEVSLARVKTLLREWHWKQ